MAALNIRSVDSNLYVSIQNTVAGNSFGIDQAQELNLLLKKKEFNALVWQSGDSSIWCSGGNLKFYNGLKSKIDGLRANRQIRASLDALAKSKTFTIAAVDGDCFGGGLELLSCFDVVISTPDSLFGFWQRKIGLSFGWGGGSRLLRRVSECQLLQSTLRVATISSYQAQSMGLVDEIVPKELVGEKIAMLIERQGQLPQTPFAKIKNWTPKNEVAIFEKLWFNDEHKNVLSKFKY